MNCFVCGEQFPDLMELDLHLCEEHSGLLDWLMEDWEEGRYGSIEGV